MNLILWMVLKRNYVGIRYKDDNYFVLNKREFFKNSIGNCFMLNNNLEGKKYIGCNLY